MNEVIELGEQPELLELTETVEVIEVDEDQSTIEIIETDEVVELSESAPEVVEITEQSRDAVSVYGVRFLEGTPDDGDVWTFNVATGMWEHQQVDPVIAVELVGWKTTGPGADVDIRFRARPVVDYVRVHVQSSAAGGEDYNPTTYVSSTQIDCRTTKQQDVVVPRNGVDRFYVFLVPVQAAA